MSIIEDRREGFLQAVLVAPVSRAAIVLGKVLGGTSVAVLQAGLFLALGPLLGLPISPLSALALLAVLFLVGFGLTALGFCIAWGLDSVQGFHAVMMVLLMPMWLLSGAFFPARGVPELLGVLMAANPMTYGVASLRHALYLEQPDRAGPIPEALPSLALTLLFAAACFGLAFVLAGRRDQGRRGTGRKGGRP
jgi:ABC-2 type transport system permease protein